MGFKDIVRRPSIVGIVFGLVFMAMSLTPSLIPRAWVQQAAISALTFVCGYGLGVALNGIWRYLELPVVPPARRQLWHGVALGAGGLLLLAGLFQTLGWQNNVRAMVSQPPVDSMYPLRTVLLAAVLVIVLLLFFRLLWWMAVSVMRLANRVVPHRYGRVLGFALGLWLVLALVDGTLFRAVSDLLNTTYSVKDTGTYDNVVAPTSALRSGGPDSLVTWESLGREGRRFAATGPAVDDLAGFWGEEPVLEPIRVFVGTKSAPTLDERADLVLQELIRTRAFDRRVLVVVTSTGSGWIDANAVDSLEYMYRGDTALAGFQYSYLPSTYALLADKDAATNASMAVFNRIHEYWQTLDEASRPELYLHGLSLGAYGSQAAVSHVSQFNDPVDGALWAGPPFVSEFWRQITQDRDPGTPIWRPVYQDGTTIRFTNMGEGLFDDEAAWRENRFVYVQQAGDPIVFFTVDSLFERPEWLAPDSRSPKAPSEMRWYPLATFWQLIFDMVLATSDTLPDGNGHRYPSASYIDAWAAVTQPDNWREEQTAELKALFDSMSNPNKP